MKLQLEKEIFRHLSEILDSKYSAMLVMGHSTDDRPKPYTLYNDIWEEATSSS